MSYRNILFVFLIINYLFFFYYLSIVSNSNSSSSTKTPSEKVVDIFDDNKGWISSSLYNELNSYIVTRNNTTHHIKKTLIIDNGTVNYVPLNSNYISFIKDDETRSYPYSTWKCSKIKHKIYKEGSEYCILTNIYYESSRDEYYFFQNPSELIVRDTFYISYGEFQLNVTDQIKIIKSLNHSSILLRPNLITEPPHQNYAHAFLETCGPRFWVLSECQSHSLHIDPEKIQIYYSSEKFKKFPWNWENYQRQSDGTYLPKRQWEQMIHSMFSIYPLLTFNSFNKTNILFKFLLFTSHQAGRTPIWGHHYQERPFKSYPFPTVYYRRAYLAFSEWILNNFNLKSKFQLTNIQEELQKKKILEEVPICEELCSIKQVENTSLDEYSGEWIVVLNRAGVGRREIKNADQLIEGLLKTFPDHSNPYLRVWPKQLNFDSNLYSTARMARSIRVLIGVHGAGLSNSLFMRPGTILYEINPYACRYLSFNFRRWAEIFNLQHALWIPSHGDNQRQDNICKRESMITLNVQEIIEEIKNMLKNEMQYRNGYTTRALQILNDLSILDHPPSGFEKIF